VALLVDWSVGFTADVWDLDLGTREQEAERRFDECFSKYEMCNSLHSDSIVLSNWAGTRAPLPHSISLHRTLALTLTLCRVVSCRVVSCRVVSCRAVPCRAVS
jgi:hypothetical protein